MQAKVRATEALRAWRGDRYAFGTGVLDSVGAMAAPLGKRVMLVANESPSRASTIRTVVRSLEIAGLELVPGRVVAGAAPNSPREDVYRIESYILHFQPDSIVVVGGGSSIDAVKAANVLATLGPRTPELEAYFGPGLVTAALRETSTCLRPLTAVQTAASSGSHLTKYANVTDPVAGQKKLIIDEAIVPSAALFDYGTSVTMPAGLTVDGALDGLGHCLEVFYGAGPKAFDAVAAIALPAIELILKYTKRAVDDPGDLEAREALGLATDLGGYAIMVGGTSGAHLTSFSLVDVTTHGRACGVMNPYYTVFFAPAIERQLRAVGALLGSEGFTSVSLEALSGRSLGEAVARALLNFNESVGSPSRLADLPGFTEAHITRALDAAKNPQLESKLRNMPIPLGADLIDTYMRPILESAFTGDFSRISSMRGLQN